MVALYVGLGLVAGCGTNDSSGADGEGGDAGDENTAVAGPPSGASVDEFCGAFVDLIQQAREAGAGISDAEAVTLAKQTADKLSKIGTPDDIPADARAAFELAIEKIESIPDDATRKEMDELAGDLTAEQDQNLSALTTYVTQKCMALPSGAPSN